MAVLSTGNHERCRFVVCWYKSSLLSLWSVCFLSGFVRQSTERFHHLSEIWEVAFKKGRDDHFNGVQEVPVSKGSLFSSDLRPAAHVTAPFYDDMKKAFFLLSSSNLVVHVLPFQFLPGQQPTTEEYFYPNRSFYFHITMSANDKKNRTTFSDQNNQARRFPIHHKLRCDQPAFMRRLCLYV